MAKSPAKPVIPPKKPAAAAVAPKKGPAPAKKPEPAKPKKAPPKPVEEVEETPEETEEGTVEEHGNKDLGIEELEAMWEDAEAPSFGDVPDNDYQVQILGAKREQKGGIWRVVFQMKILNTDQKGRMLWKRDNLDNEDRIGYFKAGVARLGHEVKSFKDLDGVLEELTNSYAEVTAKTKPGKGANEGKEFQNYFFNKALDESDLEEAPDETPADEVEDGEPADEEAEAEDPVDEEVASDPEAEEEEPADEEVEEEAADEEAEAEAEEEEAPAEEEEAPPAKPKGKRGKPAVVEPEITVKFTEAQALKAKTAIHAAAKRNDLDPSDYSNLSDLIADVGEFVGISGEFKTPEALIAEISKRNKVTAK